MQSQAHLSPSVQHQFNVNGLVQLEQPRVSAVHVALYPVPTAQSAFVFAHTLHTLFTITYPDLQTTLHVAVYSEFSMSVSVQGVQTVLEVALHAVVTLVPIKHVLHG